jgi:hypothetical protein
MKEVEADQKKKVIKDAKAAAEQASIDEKYALQKKLDDEAAK